jgi:formylglycine-generating enzyme required for sulfatase activity
MLKFPRRQAKSAILALVILVWLVGVVTRADEIRNSVGMTLRLIEAGRFEMGESDLAWGFHKDHIAFNTAEDDRPRHAVVLTRPFYLATTEVSVRQFRQFVEATGYVTSAEKNPRGAVGWDPRAPADRPQYVATFREGDEFDWQHPGFEQGDDHPVVGVSFADAQAYCQWLSRQEGVAYRLPTEAQWEYAARAGTQTYFSFGDNFRGQIQRFANIGNVELERAFPDRVRRQWLVDIDRDPSDKHVFTAPAGSYEPNPWGLYDLYGNVWEWCEDRYLDTAYTPYDRAGYQQVRKRAIDPLNDQKLGGEGDWRVIRGGSWFNAPIQCRSSVRGYFEAGDAACYVGFRVVREAPQALVAAARERFEASEAARQNLERLADRIQERRDGRLTIELSQQRQRLSDEFFAALKALAEPVDLHIDGRNELTAAQLAALAQAPRLRGLHLSGIGPGVTDADLAVLADHPQLELLHLTGGAKLTDGLIPHLARLDQLEQLELDAAEITDDGLQRLPALKRLRTLRLARTQSRGLALARLAGAPLENFSCDHLSNEGAGLLAEFRQLRELWLAGSPLTAPGLAQIARLPLVSNLDLSGCRELADEDFAVLGDLDELRWLQLPETAAGDRAVAGLVRLNNLQALRIGSSELSDAGARRICEVVSLRNLVITGDAAQLTDAALADLWRLVNLDSLEISAPQLTGSGLASLHELPQLQWLSLGSPALGDAALENAARSSSLERLFVGNWQAGGPPAVSDAGVLHLAGARSLKQFDLIRRGTKITDEGLAALRQRRSELTVNAR